jgi:hypothetical protein
MNVWKSIKQAPWYYLLETPRETLRRLFHLSDEQQKKMSEDWDEIFTTNGTRTGGV